MAKKKNKSSNNADKINAALLDDLQLPEPLDMPSAEPQPNMEEDEFDALLRNFIDSEESAPTQNEILPAPVDKPATTVCREIAQLNLGPDENELAQAYANLLDAVTVIADQHQLPLPDFYFEAPSLHPNYKPSIGRQIVADAMLCWDILFAAYPDKFDNLNPSAKDEEFLNFAENLADQNLQLAIISYVEILIDIENCELSYEEKRLKAQRRRIERILYEEYLERQEARKKFIAAICKKGFPIDAERLITNYFKNALKDAKGAYQALITNPSVYAPIETSKIKPRLFGLIKPSPKDGIRENHRIGEFLKHLKVKH